MPCPSPYHSVPAGSRYLAHRIVGLHSEKTKVRMRLNVRLYTYQRDEIAASEPKFGRLLAFWSSMRI